MFGKHKRLQPHEFDIYCHLHSKMKALRIHVSKRLPEEKKEEFVDCMVQKEKVFMHKMMGW